MPPRSFVEERVLRSARLDPVEVVREQALEQLVGARALDLELAHVRDVEDAAVRPHGAMLGDDAVVLDRQFPAGEGDHASAGLDVAVVQRRAEQGLRHGRMLKAHRADGRRSYSSRRKDGHVEHVPGDVEALTRGARSGRSRSVGASLPPEVGRGGGAARRNRSRRR